MAMAPQEMTSPGRSSCDTNAVSNADEFQAAEQGSEGREDDRSLGELIYGDWVDDDEEEDEDWQPAASASPRLVEVEVKWFCVNCTMSNPEEGTHCRLCGEHRHSGILKYGHFAPALLSDEATPETPGKRLSVKRTAVGFDDRMLLHEELHMRSNPHPERPDRLRAIFSGFIAAGLYPGGFTLIPTREITRAELETVHTHEHVNIVENTANLESSYFTADTYANSHSALAARLAAGICADLTSAILSGQVDNGFALVRPPGHHAEDSTVMGFCLHNNACIAAKAAQAAGAKKILILDWDVHHGNGTQEIFERDPSVLYVSLHRHEGGLFYPGSGAAHEAGSGPGEGFSVNIPWPCAGIGDNDYMFAMQHVVLPIAKQFGPDITIISAGFDAARGDPLGGCEVTPIGFAHMTHMLASVSAGKLLVVLEGGYNLRSISVSATAVLNVLRGEAPEGLKEEECQPSEAGVAAVMEVFAVQSKYWSSLSATSFLKLTMNGHGHGHGMKVKKPKRKRPVVPICWKWGRRRLMYMHWFRLRT